MEDSFRFILLECFLKTKNTKGVEKAGLIIKKLYLSRSQIGFVLCALMLDALLDSNVLADESRNLMRLVRLDARHSLLHQITAFHVQEEEAVVRLDFTSRYHLRVRVMHQCFLF
jgi:hypothetical protein